MMILSVTILIIERVVEEMQGQERLETIIQVLLDVPSL